MAIIIGKANTFKRELDNNSNAIRQQQEIAIESDGTIHASNIDLGNQGDDGVTILHFDVSNFKPQPFKNRYQPVIICRDSNGVSQTFDFDGQYFYVPNNITKNAGTYTLVYAIYERDENTGDDSGNTENVENHIEIFTSSIFTGIVRPTNYLLITEEPETPPSVTSIEAAEIDEEEYNKLRAQLNQDEVILPAAPEIEPVVETTNVIEKEPERVVSMKELFDRIQSLEAELNELKKK